MDKMELLEISEQLERVRDDLKYYIQKFEESEEWTGEEQYMRGWDDASTWASEELTDSGLAEDLDGLCSKFNALVHRHEFQHIPVSPGQLPLFTNSVDETD